jgi:negative regulator of flagellin synthesis FlgM
VAGGSSLARDLAGMGAPIDSDKVAAIRTAIAEGRYPVNPDRIAEAMLSLDLPAAK